MPRSTASLPYARNVSAFAKTYKDNPLVQVLDVGVNQRDHEFQRWVRLTRPQHPVLKGTRDFIRRLMITRTPTTIVLNQDREIIYRHEGTWSRRATNEIHRVVKEAIR